MYESSGGAVSFAVEFAWSFVCIALDLMAAVISVTGPGRTGVQPAGRLLAARPADARCWAGRGSSTTTTCHLRSSQARGGDPNHRWYKRAAALLRVARTRARLGGRRDQRVLPGERRSARRPRPARVAVVRNGPRRPRSCRAAPRRPRATTCTIVYLGVLGAAGQRRARSWPPRSSSTLRGRGGWRLVIAGDGECLASLQALTAERKLGDVVEFTGWLGGGGRRLLRTATVGSQPDLRRG